MGRGKARLHQMGLGKARLWMLTTCVGCCVSDPVGGQDVPLSTVVHWCLPVLSVNQSQFGVVSQSLFFILYVWT